MFCPCPSVHPSPLSKRKVCVINSSQSFQAINLKLCTYIKNILKMCMRIFADEKMIFDKITAFSTETSLWLAFNIG